MTNSEEVERGVLGLLIPTYQIWAKTCSLSPAITKEDTVTASPQDTVRLVVTVLLLVLVLTVVGISSHPHNKLRSLLLPQEVEVANRKSSMLRSRIWVESLVRIRYQHQKYEKFRRKRCMPLSFYFLVVD